MNKIRISFFTVLLFFVSGVIFGQNATQNELVVIDGERFILHQVRTGETVFSISKNFKVNSSDLQKYNPSISQGISIGEILKIPFNEEVDLSELPRVQKGDPTSFINHTIQSRKETAYSLSKQYGITVEEIYAYNPTVRKFKKGTVLKIPQWNFEVLEEKEEEPVVVEEKPLNTMQEHVVVSGETLYSISKHYNISISEILYYNSGAKDLKAGSVLTFPKAVTDTKNEQSSDDHAGFILHTVVSGETLYGITKKYNVSEEELLAFNPEIKTSFRTGTRIRIPSDSNVETKNDVFLPVFSESNKRVIGESLMVLKDAPEECQPSFRTGFYEPIQVALFLPLFLEANKNLNKDFIVEADSVLQNEVMDTIDFGTEFSLDTTIIEEEKPMPLLKQFYGNSENFLQFYEGVLIAVDSLKKAGINIELRVFDTKDNPAQIREATSQSEFRNTDLIIGPVYENVQQEVARVASANNIPMISPFISNSKVINNYPQFFQVNPSRNYIIEATAEMMAVNDTNLNYVVLETSAYGGTPEGYLVELMRKKIETSKNPLKSKFTVYDFRTKRIDGFPEILEENKENIFIIPSSDEGELSVAISNLNNSVDTMSITLIGTSNYQQKYPSIQLVHFHNLKLKYINPYWVDYSDSATILYFQKFISNFGTEPNGFGVQGFDVAYYFLNAIHYFGNDFENCLPYFDIKLLQGDYYFEKVSQWGGFMNRGVSVIRYNRKYEVKQDQVIGKPKVWNEYQAASEKIEPFPEGNSKENGSGNR